MRGTYPAWGGLRRAFGAHEGPQGGQYFKQKDASLPIAVTAKIHGVEGWIMPPPKGLHVLILKTSEYVLLHGKGILEMQLS